VLVESAERRFAGGARNLGIRHSRAPVVAFLASDCLATAGWLQARLAVHQGGEMAVSSALAPAPDAAGLVNTVTWAAYAMTHIGRTPHTSASLASCYGLSYNRVLFDRHGTFNERLEVGEDTDFNKRISAHNPTGWHPDVVTLHRYPATLFAAVKDQIGRGRRSATHYCLEEGRTPARHIAHVLLHGLLVNRRIAQRQSPPETRRLSVRLLTAVLVLANMIGVLSLYAKGMSSTRSAPAGRA
jgi:glycosyltransferase involved in cell wall biosynthesis